MDSNLPLVSLVCSTSQSEASVSDFHGALFRVLRALEGSYRFEILYANAAQPAVRGRLDGLAELDPRVRVLADLEAASGEMAVRAGLEQARGDLVVMLDGAAHSPEIIPHLLEQAQGSCDIVLGVAPTLPHAKGLSRLWTKPSTADISPLLLKRPAADALRALRDSPRSLRELAIATGLQRAEIPFTPHRAPAATTAPRMRAFVVQAWAQFARDPLTVITYFGATVFLLGVFLAAWFTLQGMVAPNSVWFSWCYLIVLLHVLGGSTLYALGKVGALAARILEQAQEGSPQVPREPEVRLASPPPNDTREAA